MKRNLVITAGEAWKMAVDPVATGKSLRRMRKEAGITQEKLADIITDYCDFPATSATVSYWETGRRAMSLAHAVFISNLFGCKLDELVVSIMRSYGKEQEDDRLVPFYLQMWLLPGAIGLRRFYFITHLCSMHFPRSI